MKEFAIPKKHRVNDEIRTPEIHLIDQDGNSFGNVTIDQARWLAFEKGLDLVEVGPNAQPPVVRILDYGKYLYEQSKADSKSKTRAPEIKGLRLKAKIGEHDFAVKRRKAQDWLANGDRVRVQLRLYGREMMFQDRAKELIERLRVELEAEYQTPIQLLGTTFSTILGKKK